MTDATRHRSMADIGHDECRWPIGDPKEPGFHLCGAPALPGMPYCAEHAAVAYAKKSRGPVWSPTDDRDLMAMAERGLSTGRIAEDMGRTKPAVEHRLSHLLVKALEQRGGGMNPPLAPLHPTRYGVILADPPWRFRTWSERGNGKPCPYDTMTLGDIAALPVADIAARDSMCVLWFPAPFLEGALDVLRSWGFRYSTMGGWHKTLGDGRPAIGTGYYWRSTAEFWLVGTKGSPGRVKGMAIPNSIIAPRREHSRKPCRLHRDLDAMYPGVSKCELFSRERRPGWDAWGNEVGKFDDHFADTSEMVRDGAA